MWIAPQPRRSPRGVTHSTRCGGGGSGESLYAFKSGPLPVSPVGQGPCLCQVAAARLRGEDVQVSGTGARAYGDSGVQQLLQRMAA